MNKINKSFLKNQKIFYKHKNRLSHQKLVFLFLLLIGFIFISCTQSKTSSNVSPDNSAKNRQDIAGGPLTPEDHSNSKPDVDLTQTLRSKIVQDDSLSLNAHNVKIITLNGIITLRGPVNSFDEKEKIYSKAQEVAGVDKVINQLEIVAH